MSIFVKLVMPTTLATKNQNLNYLDWLNQKLHFIIFRIKISNRAMSKIFIKPITVTSPKIYFCPDVLDVRDSPLPHTVTKFTLWNCNIILNLEVSRIRTLNQIIFLECIRLCTICNMYLVVESLSDKIISQK